MRCCIHPTESVQGNLPLRNLVPLGMFDSVHFYKKVP